MSEKKNNILIQLSQWLHGNARRSDEAELDRAAQSDDFLRDAMDGYRTFPASDHTDRTDALRERIRQRTARDRNIRVLPWMRVAAGVFVVLIAVGGFYYLNQPTTPALAERKTTDGGRETTYEERETVDGARETVDGKRETEDGERETTDEKQETVDGEQETTDEERETEGPRSSESGMDAETQNLASQQKGNASQQDNEPETADVKTQDLASQQDAEAQDVAPPQENLAPQQDDTPPPAEPTPSLARRGIATLDAAAPVRQGRIVDTAGQPVPGVELRTSDRQEVIALSDAQGRITIDTAVQRLIVERTGFRPVQWSVERSAAPYLQLQPAEEAAPASYSLKSMARSAQEAPVPVAYPSVGYDSLRQWLQERTAMPRRLLPFSFTVYRDGRLSKVVPATPEDAAYVEEIFSLLQQGPVWVLPPGVDSVRVDFQF